MLRVKRSISFPNDKASRLSRMINNECLVSNGLGGYASFALSGGTTRKYHGVLVASLPAPLGRTVMLNFVEDSLVVDEKAVPLSIQEVLEKSEVKVFNDEVPSLIEFCLDDGLPSWIYQVGAVKIKKSIFLVYKQNTVHITYQLIEGPPSLELRFKPFFQFRHHESAVDKSILEEFQCMMMHNHYEINSSNFPPLRLVPTPNSKFIIEKQTIENVFYRVESERGYESVGPLQSPGYFSTQIELGQKISFSASTEEWDIISLMSASEALSAEKERRNFLLTKAERLNPQLANSSFASELVLATDQFVTFSSRILDVAWSHAIGKEARTVIAGYHWFTDWGRDTMISLEGLTLINDRIEEAACILRLFAHHVKFGLIPNMFPDRQKEGTYNTADATLWFFQALHRYFTYSQDDCMIQILLPTIKEIIYSHVKGTKFGIKVDEQDGLLIQGAEHVALTWMDAKVGEFVVTPRRGKTVEINALWYNALRLAINWIQRYDKESDISFFQQLAEKCYESFNKKFWCESTKHLNDIIDGENGTDFSCRPNQILALSLKHPVLKSEFWQPVVDNVKEKLLTPFGLRSLSQDHPDYKNNYNGNLFVRDTAYHQGTVWAWLIGPFIDAWLRTYPGKIEDARNFLKGFEKHLAEGCIGSISEIFDAAPPYAQRGCVAQAWSVAEVLRCWNKIASLINSASSEDDSKSLTKRFQRDWL